MPTLPGMDTSTLPRHAYHHLMHTLRQNLPPAPPGPTAAIARDYAAIAQVAALCPANAAEAAIAAQAVAANAQAMVTMGLANDPATDPKQLLQCIAQAGSMMRHAQGALRILRLMQAERRKREETDASAESSAWIEYAAAQWMAEALPPSDQTSNDQPDQNPEHRPTPHVHETEPAETQADAFQNQGHDPEPRFLETETTPSPPPPGATSNSHFGI